MTPANLSRWLRRGPLLPILSAGQNARFGAAPVRSGTRAWVSLLLGAGLLVGCACTHAQVLPSMLPGAAAPASAAASASALTAEELADLVARAQERVQRLDAAASVRPDAPLLDRRRQAAERLLALLQMRQQLASAQHEKQPADASPLADQTALPPGLAGAPPFSALAVDVLRDQRDGLQIQKKALQVSLESLDEQGKVLLQARRKAGERARLHQERIETPSPTVDSTEARAALELAQLEELGAAEELALLEIERSGQRARLTRLEPPLESLNAQLARVRSAQRLDEADLAAVQRRSESQQLWVSQERRRLASRLASRAGAATADGADVATRENDALRMGLRFLADLESVERDHLAYWQLRKAVYADPAAGSTPAAIPAPLAQAGERIAARLRVVNDRLGLLLSTQQLQRTRLAALAEGDAARSNELAVLAAQEASAEALSRVRDSLTRSATVIARALEDLGDAGRPADAQGWLRWTTKEARDVFDRVWQFELFSASEVTQVDGRTVTVDHGVTVGKSLGALMLLAIGYWAAGALSRMLVGLTARRLQFSVHLARVLHRWLNSIFLLVVVLLVLKMARIPLTAFAFLGGALAIGIGFGAQNVIKNLISGVIILFERKVRVGDIVTIGGMTGTILAVDLRATTVRGFDGIDAIVPNSTLLETQISNWSGGSPEVRRAIGITVAPGCDVNKASELLIGCARAHGSVLSDPPPTVLFDDIGKDSLALCLQYWIRLKGPRSGPAVDSDLRYAINNALHAAGSTAHSAMPSPPAERPPCR